MHESRNTSTSSCQKAKSPARYSSGMATTIPAQIRSASTLARLNPSRSTSGPPSTAASADPIPIAAPVRPILTALPVVTRTNQGTASVVMLFPTEEMTSAPSSEKIGTRSATARPRSSPVGSSWTAILANPRIDLNYSGLCTPGSTLHHHAKR